MIKPNDPTLSVRKQCRFLKVPRATYYRHRKPPSDQDLAIMRRMDELYLRVPFYGTRKLRHILRQEDFVVSHKRLQRLQHWVGSGEPGWGVRQKRTDKCVQSHDVSLVVRCSG